MANRTFKNDREKLEYYRYLELREKAGRPVKDAMKSPDIPAAQKLWPRTWAAFEKNAPESEKWAAAFADSFSSIGRGLASAPDLLKGWDAFTESYSKTRGTREKDGGILNKIGATIGDIVRSPSTAAATLAVPVVGPGAGIIGRVGAGLGEAGAGAVAGQIENIGEGKKASLKEGAVETIAGGAIPLIGAPLRAGAKKAGMKIVESVLKPGVNKKQYIGSKFDISNVFKLGLDSPLGLKAMAKKVEKFKSSIEKQYDSALKEIPKAKIDIQDALDNAKTELRSLIESGKFADEEKGIERGLNFWQKYLNGHMKTKDIPVSEALAIRRSAANLAKYGKKRPESITGVDRASDIFYKNINQKLEKFPKIRELDKVYTQTLPIQKTIQEAIPRTDKNFSQSLLQNPSMLLAGMGLGGYVGGQQGMAAGMIPAAATFGISSAMRSPGFGSLLYRGAGAPSDLAEFALQRTMAQKYRGGE